MQHANMIHYCQHYVSFVKPWMKDSYHQSETSYKAESTNYGMGSTRSHLGIKLVGLAELAATFNQFHSSMGTRDFENQPQVSYFHL